MIQRRWLGDKSETEGYEASLQNHSGDTFVHSYKANESAQFCRSFSVRESSKQSVILGSINKIKFRTTQLLALVGCVTDRNGLRPLSSFPTFKNVCISKFRTKGMTWKANPNHSNWELAFSDIIVIFKSFNCESP